MMRKYVLRIPAILAAVLLTWHPAQAEGATTAGTCLKPDDQSLVLNNDRYQVVKNGNGTISLKNSTTGKLLPHEFPYAQDNFSGAAISASGKYIVLQSDHEMGADSIELFDVATGKRVMSEIGVYRGDDKEWSFFDIAFVPDGDVLLYHYHKASSMGERNIRINAWYLYDPRTGEKREISDAEAAAFGCGP